MLLGLLLGNTSLRYGLHDGARLIASGRASWAALDREAVELRRLISGAEIHEIVVGSVRDDLFPRVAPWLPTAAPTRFARRDFPLPIESCYDPPQDVGTDRLLNAIAARARACSRGAVVVDFGTAVSLSVVSPLGAFVGGLISPGARAMLLGLQTATPMLPAVDLTAPSRFLQPRTTAAIQAGVAWQVIGGVREMVRGLVAEIETLPSSPGSAKGSPLVLATGGDASLFAAFLPEIHEVVPDLTLEGLFLAHRHSG